MIASLYQSGSVALPAFFTRVFSESGWMRFQHGADVIVVSVPPATNRLDVALP